LSTRYGRTPVRAETFRLRLAFRRTEKGKIALLPLNDYGKSGTAGEEYALWSLTLTTIALATAREVARR
jgi:hypothetical protein